MKSYRRAWLAHMDVSIDQQKRQQEFLRKQQQQPSVQSSPQPPPPPKLNRAARRRNELFNRKLKEKLEKQGTPTQVQVLPDGGLHVTLSKEELEAQQAEGKEVPQEPEGEV